MGDVERGGGKKGVWGGGGERGGASGGACSVAPLIKTKVSPDHSTAGCVSVKSSSVRL